MDQLKNLTQLFEYLPVLRNFATGPSGHQTPLAHELVGGVSWSIWQCSNNAIHDDRPITC
jgi:hypothetical protein